MKDYKDEGYLDLSGIVIEVFQVHRRIGFSKPQIEISHCLIEGEGPGFHIDLYDENTGYEIGLYTIAEKDCQETNLQEIVMRLAREIMKKTGLDIKVIDEIQGTRMEYDEHDEKMWIARMAMQGIDNDY
ncbi:hypothetical protein V7152_28305 [Neobacillus drentensis]|uniref:hypothetical protein n=1 Tax=Neobacillus drentensis TaxID=220684 RepID=UPI002FFEFA5B